MAKKPLISSEMVLVEYRRFQDLIDALLKNGYETVGPTIREGGIVYEHIARMEDLPVGWTDEQDHAHYRLKQQAAETLFNYVVGPQSWKKYLLPPFMTMFESRIGEEQLEFVEPARPIPSYAFIGVRACELAALEIQDKVLASGQYADPYYKSCREKLFIVAVNCGQAGGNCFCVSMDTGPRVKSGFDLALTEILEGDAHYFLVEIGSEKGRDILKEVAHHPASEEIIEKAENLLRETAGKMGRTLEMAGLKEILYENYENPRWDNVAARCLTCGNCTMVCPTCFCTRYEDSTDLSGQTASRNRYLDSCFNTNFSYIHGGSIRATVKSRYRQWLTHKLATWQDQFGTSGCVGCGRCITWCPVGIDITEEARAIRQSAQLNK
jgi:ferredoxin